MISNLSVSPGINYREKGFNAFQSYNTSYQNSGTFQRDSISISSLNFNRLTPYSSQVIPQRDTSSFFNAEGFIMAGLVASLAVVPAGIGAGIGAIAGNARLGAVIGLSAGLIVPVSMFAYALFNYAESRWSVKHPL